jgi:hypothetical protein
MFKKIYIFQELLSCKFVRDSYKTLWMIHDLFQNSISESSAIQTLISYSVELSILKDYYVYSMKRHLTMQRKLLSSRFNFIDLVYFSNLIAVTHKEVCTFEDSRAQSSFTGTSSVYIEKSFIRNLRYF